MKSKQKKSEEIRQLKVKIPGSKIVVVTTFSKAGEKGLSVSQMTALKKTLREMDSEYLIAKKSLVDLAFKGLKADASVGSPTSEERRGYDGLDIFGVEGSVGLTLGRGEDYYSVAKKLYDFSKKNPALQFSGAFIDGSFIDIEKFLEIAKMPSREVLLGRLVGMLTYPVRGLAVALNEVAKVNNANATN